MEGHCDIEWLFGIEGQVCEKLGQQLRRLVLLCDIQWMLLVCDRQELVVHGRLEQQWSKQELVHRRLVQQ